MGIGVVERATAAASVAGLSRAAPEAACIGASAVHSPLRVLSTPGAFCFGRAVAFGLASSICAFSTPLLHLMLSRGDSRRTNQHLDSLGGDHECAGSRAR
jgi:hypothetical protein